MTDNDYQNTINELKEELKKSNEATARMRELNVQLQLKLQELTREEELASGNDNYFSCSVPEVNKELISLLWSQAHKYEREHYPNSPTEFKIEGQEPEGVPSPIELFARITN